MIIATEYQTVTPRLFAWRVYDPAVKCDLWSTAIASLDGLILVDPVELESFPELAERFPPTAVILTSGNHARASAAFRERWKVPVWAPSSAILSITEISVDRAFASDEALPGGLRAVDLPSAGPGEVALLGDGVLCFGDAVINLPSTGLALLPDKYCAAPGELRNDVRKLLSCDFDILTFAHGDPIVQDAKARLHQLLV